MKILRSLERIFRKIFVLDKWYIGISCCSCESFLESQALTEVKWIRQSASEYRADPFVIRYADQLYCFYEEYDWTTDCGVLKCLRIDQSELDAVPVHLEGLEDVHLSYPYVFVRGSEAYLIPECAEKSEIALYKANQFPNHWCKVTTIARGDSFVDSSLFYDNGRYWVVSSVSGSEGLVYVFFTESLETEWSPHPLNPIPVETNATRGAGRIFCYDGIWYRPTQVASFEYGSAIQMNRIRLSLTSFEQYAAFNLSPIKPYLYGIHNIDIETRSGIIVIDGKSLFPSLYSPFAKALGKLRKRKRLRAQRARKTAATITISQNTY